MDFDHAKRQHDAATKTAAKIMQDDWLLRNLIHSCVSEAMHYFGPVDPERAEVDARDIAVRSVALAVAAMIQRGDHRKAGHD